MKTALKVAASVGIAVLVIFAIIGFTFFCIAMVAGLASVIYMIFFDDM